MLGVLKERRLRARGLFPYWDGTRRRWGDPFAIYRLLASGEAKLPDLADAVDQGKEPETSQAIEIIAKAFDVQRWDGHAGLIDNEILALVRILDAYVEEVKKKTQRWADLIATFGLDVLSFQGAPKKDGYLLLGLSHCQEHIEVRRAFQLMSAVQDAFEPAIPLRYFVASYGDDEEAIAMHNLHKDRIRYAQGQPIVTEE